ncbi:MAG: YcxB family protein [Bradyrhizobium sp.]
MIGQFSLAAVLLGTVAMVIAGSFVRRIAVRRYLAGTPNAFESKTAVFDATGITLSGQISQTMWRWAAVSRFTSEKDLLLIWIGQSAGIAIPRRSFASNNACNTAKAFIRARLSDK